MRLDRAFLTLCNALTGGVVYQGGSPFFIFPVTIFPYVPQVRQTEEALISEIGWVHPAVTIGLVILAAWAIWVFVRAVLASFR